MYKRTAVSVVGLSEGSLHADTIPGWCLAVQINKVDLKKACLHSACYDALMPAKSFSNFFNNIIILHFFFISDSERWAGKMGERG